MLNMQGSINALHSKIILDDVLSTIAVRPGTRIDVGISRSSLLVGI